MEHDLLAIRGAALQLSKLVIALADVDHAQARPSAVVDEQRPSLFDTEQAADRNFHHVICVPDVDAGFDAITVAQLCGRGRLILEIGE